MELQEYIKRGEAAAGGRPELAKILEQKANAITDAKGHRRGLPVYACIKLAHLINADPMEVIAASELVTETREDRKAVFLPFVQVARHAQHLTIAGIALTTALALENSVSIVRAFSL